jgi:hypothetical protein
VLQQRIRSEQWEEVKMWGGMVGLVIQLIAGAVGGNIAGSLKQYNLGAVGNTAQESSVEAWGRRLSERSSAAEQKLPPPGRVASISARSSVRSHPVESAGAS